MEKVRRGRLKNRTVPVVLSLKMCLEMGHSVSGGDSGLPAASSVVFILDFNT